MKGEDATNPTSGTALALPRRCSIASGVRLAVRRARPFDTDVMRGRLAAVGSFRCPLGHPEFRNTGPISEDIVVFPRTSVWIRHEGSSRFLADPNVVTLYNREQVYERFPLSPEGDRCDWFALSSDAAREVVASFDPSAAATERPFRFERAPSTASLYLRQRAILARARWGDADELWLEEEVLAIVAEVLALAYRRAPEPLARRVRARKRRHDLVEATRAELVRSVEVNRSVRDIAHALGTSPFHLCRVFRAATGCTLHGYRTELRVRLALEMLEGSGEGASLSAVAYRAGFASHSHLVRAMRRSVNAAPSVVRQQLSGAGRAVPRSVPAAVSISPR